MDATDTVRQKQKQLLTPSPRVGTIVSVPATWATDGAMVVEEPILGRGYAAWIHRGALPQLGGCF